eukprot:scaffold269_cov229-Pinguiococcus_pyrenoidosus.AAC.3
MAKGEMSGWTMGVSFNRWCGGPSCTFATSFSARSFAASMPCFVVAVTYRCGASAAPNCVPDPSPHKVTLAFASDSMLMRNASLGGRALVSATYGHQEVVQTQLSRIDAPGIRVLQRLLVPGQHGARPSHRLHRGARHLDMQP